jgi:hypothetical protein
MIRIQLGPTPGTIQLSGRDPGLRALLQPGQTVKATVARQPDGRLIARLGRLALPLPQGAAPEPGSIVRLQVSAQPGERLLLTMLPKAPAAGGDAAAALQRRDLPRSASTLSALQPLPALQGTASSEGSRLPTAVQEALGELLQRLPTPRQLVQADSLRLALRDSGSLFESLLLHSGPDQTAAIASRDLKAVLARAAARLRADSGTAAGGPANAAPTSPQAALAAEAGRGVESLLARLTLLQGASLSGETGVDLAFELPLRAGDSLQALELRIRDDTNGGAGGGAAQESSWVVDLRFRFAPDDSLQARIRLHGDQAVAVTWIADRPETAAAIEQALPHLTAALEAAGLEVRHVSAREGSVSTQHPALESRPAGGLLHERI